MDALAAEFRSRFGAEPMYFAQAPGRVNLIGEHTDYHDGLCFPAAIDAWVCVAARESERTCISTSISTEKAEFDANAADRSAMATWARYPAGVAWAIGEATGKRVANLEAVVHSTLPAGSGLSSSAAIEMAFATLWRHIGGLPISDAELARIGQRAENGFVGMNCGIMDQTASMFGKAGHALFLDTQDPAHPVAIPLPGDLAIVVCDTMVKHELAGSEYNLRRRESEDAAAKLGVTALRWATLSHLQASSHLLSPVELKRARHVISECARVQAFGNCLEVGDLKGLGELIKASHASLRDDYEVSCPELDIMAEAANNHPACMGARMMGGGFGGACIALVSGDRTQEFTALTAQAYEAQTGIAPAIRVCRAVDGARAWPADRSI